MLRCRKCGAAVISDESLIQYVLDHYEEAIDYARRCSPRQKSEALARVAEYRQIYKSLMHNISNKDYAEAVAPYILKAVLDVVREKKLMTEDEISVCYDEGKHLAQVRREQVDKEIRRVYGTAQEISALPYRDPTAREAIAHVDRERKQL